MKIVFLLQNDLGSPLFYKGKFLAITFGSYIVKLGEESFQYSVFGLISTKEPFINKAIGRKTKRSN